MAVVGVLSGGLILVSCSSKVFTTFVMTIMGRAQAPDFSRGVSERLNVERVQGMIEVESYKPARASRLHMWSGCPKARIRLPTEIGGAGSSEEAS